MQNNRAATRISRSLAAWLLSASCSVPTMWAQSDGCDRRAGRQESQAQTSAPSANTSTTSQTQDNSSKRIFGVVPAYNITDAQNAPSLTSAQKFGLFVKGTLDPFPIAVYAAQAGVSQASGTHRAYGQGAAGYGKRFGAALLDGTSARFFGTYAFPSLLHQDPRYFRKVRGVPGHDSAIPCLGDL